jgi:methionyl-tRNA synthetase
MLMDKYYLTTAIDYANAAPHIGHAYEKLGADVTARYRRLTGYDVFFLTGTDEHGSKVENTARDAGMSPQEFVDEIAGKFQEAWKRLLISYDSFIRTTDPKHKKVVQEIFRKMRDKGDIYKGSYTGLYCEGCEDYKNERDLVEGKCPNHNRAPIQATEENYFFKLTNYKDALRKWLNTEPCPVKPDFRRREVINQLDDEEFGDFSVSRPRTSLNWGIGVPDDPDHVIYVWVDALTNYITGVGYGSDEKMWQRYWPADLHLVGKDIVKFHCLYWPAMLMSAEIEPAKLVFSHGFITVEGQKMSKTLGNVLDPIALVEAFPVDAVRYYMCAANTYSHDADFARADLIKIANGHLANNYGNLLNRMLTLIDKNCEGKIPSGTINSSLMKRADELQAEYRQYMEEFEFAKALESVRSIVDEANKYLNDQKPWTLFKEEKHQEGASVLLTSLELIKKATVLYAPFVPQLAARVWNQLGYDSNIEKVKLNDEQASSVIPTGQLLRNSGPPFPRLEEPAAQVATPGKK